MGWGACVMLQVEYLLHCTCHGAFERLSRSVFLQLYALRPGKYGACTCACARVRMSAPAWVRLQSSASVGVRMGESSRTHPISEAFVSPIIEHVMKFES